MGMGATVGTGIGVGDGVGSGVATGVVVGMGATVGTGIGVSEGVRVSSKVSPRVHPVRLTVIHTYTASIVSRSIQGLRGMTTCLSRLGSGLDSAPACPAQVH